ncbi:chloride channel protein [Trypanosoma cruzi cruzi]|uniref:Chloride channel protein n=2 Tax=Trypanosoma cruzi TaxID=5693 RepID=A0A2V2UP31_TRYCR|nr:chloride channel protein [Trypanosoma cruzi cruzi]PWU84956.1 putative chloride channel protein [Trypanosoma cruzi]
MSLRALSKYCEEVEGRCENFPQSCSTPFIYKIGLVSPGRDLWNMLLKKRRRFFLPSERQKMERYESVDTYEPATIVYKDHLESRNQEPRWFIWVFVFGLGIASSVIAIVVVSLLHVLNGIRYELLGFGLRGFSFNDSNRYAMTNRTDLDIAALFEGSGVGLYGIEPRSLKKGYLMWISFSLVLSVISSLICLLVPESIGSGLPEVMAYLNGVHYPMLGSFRVLLAKVSFIIFSVASGTCTGHFGTIILTGAMLGAQALQRRRYFRCDSVHIIECFRNPRDRRVITVIAAAAGVASAFGVSIGGLMVVVELISTILPVRFAIYVFAASLVSSLTLQIYFSFFSYFSLRDRHSYPHGELISEMVQFFVSCVSLEDLVRMHIFYFIPTTLIGLFCGVLAGVFVRLSSFALGLRRWLEQRLETKAVRYVLPVLFTGIYVTIQFWVAAAVGSGGWSPPAPSPSEPPRIGGDSIRLPMLQQTMSNESNPAGLNGAMGGPCVAVPSTLLTTFNVTSISYYGANGFFCSAPTAVEDQVHEERWGMKPTLSVLHAYASLAFANADSAVQTLLSWHTEEMLGAPVLVIFLSIYFLASALFLGVSLGGDTLLPGLVIGAAVGRLFGIGVHYAAVSIVGAEAASSWADPGCFALIGAGSFLGGTTGLTFSICTILMESTSDFQHLLPLMIGITIAKKTAELFTENINTILLQMRCVPILDFENEVHKYPMFDARHVMTSHVVTLETVCTIEQILYVLRSTRHNAFPIESVRDRTYKGIIVRQQLEILLWHVYFTPYPSICTYELGKKVEARLFYDKLLGTLPPLETRLDVRIDLSPYIDHSGFCVLDKTTLPRTYTMFRTLGLRHLTVVNPENRIVGIITRKDLVTDRIIEGILAAEEYRRAIIEGKSLALPDGALITEGGSDSNSISSNKRMDKTDGNASYSSNVLGSSARRQQIAGKEYEFYRTGDWLVLGRYGGVWGDVAEGIEGLMHPSASTVAAIRAQAATRRASFVQEPDAGGPNEVNPRHVAKRESISLLDCLPDVLQTSKTP